LFLLAYASTATFDFQDGDLIMLLMNSRLNNKRLGLTGILLHDDGHFVQVLEGDEHAVRDRFARIEADPRHDGVTILLEETSPERQFPKWSMGYKTLTDPLVQQIPGYNNFLLTNPAPEATPVKALLERFRRFPELAATVNHD
jgi:hypothetical protein